MKWKAHADDGHKKVSKRLGLLGRIRSSLTVYKQHKRYTNALLNQFLVTQTQPGVNYPRAASLVCNDYSRENRHLSEKYKDSPKYCKLARFRNTAKNTQMYFSIQMFTEFRSYILKKTILK